MTRPKCASGEAEEVVVVPALADVEGDDLRSSPRIVGPAPQDGPVPITDEAEAGQVASPKRQPTDGGSCADEEASTVSGDDAAPPPRHWSVCAAGEEEEDVASVGSDSTGQETEGLADVHDPQDESRPDFTGHWVLDRTQGDFDRFLADMQQARYVRFVAKQLKYGLGKVVVKCAQAGDDFEFIKTLADPRQFGDATAAFSVGSQVSFTDEIGKVTATSSRWEGDTLVFDAVADSTRLPVQLRMYRDDRGDFVEEMVSCKATTITYYFRRQG